MTIQTMVTLLCEGFLTTLAIFLLTLIGALVGMPLGIVEHHFIMNVINSSKFIVMSAYNFIPVIFISRESYINALAEVF
jgi:hypothetical protein